MPKTIKYYPTYSKAEEALKALKKNDKNYDAIILGALDSFPSLVFYKVDNQILLERLVEHKKYHLIPEVIKISKKHMDPQNNNRYLSSLKTLVETKPTENNKKALSEAIVELLFCKKFLTKTAFEKLNSSHYKINYSLNELYYRRMLFLELANKNHDMVVSKAFIDKRLEMLDQVELFLNTTFLTDLYNYKHWDLLKDILKYIQAIHSNLHFVDKLRLKLELNTILYNTTNNSELVNNENHIKDIIIPTIELGARFYSEAKFIKIIKATVDSNNLDHFKIILRAHLSQDIIPTVINYLTNNNKWDFIEDLIENIESEYAEKKAIILKSILKADKFDIINDNDHINKNNYCYCIKNIIIPTINLGARFSDESKFRSAIYMTIVSDELEHFKIILRTHLSKKQVCNEDVFSRIIGSLIINYKWSFIESLINNTNSQYSKQKNIIFDSILKTKNTFGQFNFLVSALADSKGLLWVQRGTIKPTLFNGTRYKVLKYLANAEIEIPEKERINIQEKLFDILNNNAEAIKETDEYRGLIQSLVSNIISPSMGDGNESPVNQLFIENIKNNESLRNKVTQFIQHFKECGYHNTKFGLFRIANFDLYNHINTQFCENALESIVNINNQDDPRDNLANHPYLKIADDIPDDIADNNTASSPNDDSDDKSPEQDMEESKAENEIVNPTGTINDGNTQNNSASSLITEDDHSSLAPSCHDEEDNDKSNRTKKQGNSSLENSDDPNSISFLVKKEREKEKEKLEAFIDKTSKYLEDNESLLDEDTINQLGYRMWHSFLEYSEMRHPNDGTPVNLNEVLSTNGTNCSDDNILKPLINHGFYKKEEVSSEKTSEDLISFSP